MEPRDTDQHAQAMAPAKPFWPEGVEPQPDELRPLGQQGTDLRFDPWQGIVCHCGASWWVREGDGFITCARCSISLRACDIRPGDMFRMTDGSRLHHQDFQADAPQETWPMPTPDSARRHLEAGARFPFDAPDSWWTDPRTVNAEYAAGDWAVAAARGVIHDLRDRRDIKHGFEQVDEDVRAEIVSALAAIIRAAAPTATEV